MLPPLLPTLTRSVPSKSRWRNAVLAAMPTVETLALATVVVVLVVVVETVPVARAVEASSVKAAVGSLLVAAVVMLAPKVVTRPRPPKPACVDEAL